MDLTSSKYFEAPSFLVSRGPPLKGTSGLYERNMENPFAETFPDPLCKLHLKETSEFVKSFPMATHGAENRGYLDVSAQRRREGASSVTKRNVEAPSTPGRPIFSFSAGNLSRKSFPSKWDDAEKWLNGGSSFHDSPAHQSLRISRQCEEFSKPQAVVIFAEKSRVTEEKVDKSVSSIHGSVAFNGVSDRAFNGVSAASADVLLKDMFTKEVEVEAIFPKFRCSEPMKEGFLFGNLEDKSEKDAAAATDVAHEVRHRDAGTEMTPLGSSTTSRCHTPLKSTSPARHNTPANRSGPLDYSSSTNKTIDITHLKDCHLAKLNMGTQFDSLVSTWSSREEEEEEISKSLRHFEIGNELRKSVSEKSRVSAWEEEEKNKCCLRYQREEARIQAWVNLQSAKAEAQSRKLEVKIEKMRSDLEEKLMKRMSVVHRKAEEWRAAAQVQHTEQIERATKQAQKIVNRQNSYHFSAHTSTCGCFPCNNHRI